MKTKRHLNTTDSYRKSVFRIEHPEDEQILPIHTDKKLQKRALSFMNLLITYIEERGTSILFEYKRSHAELYNQTIEINLKQKYHRVRTVDEKGWCHQEYVKNNKLEFQTGYHVRKNWLDTDKRKIEDRIPEIVAYIEKDLTCWRDIRIQQAIDEEKTAQLFKDAENWNKAEQIRKYITAKKEKDIIEGIVNEEAKMWLLWANVKVNELAPLI